MDLSSRRPGPDVVRAVAMWGVVVMNYHGYLILRGGRREGSWAYDLFDPWVGPLATRFAATFVLTAGVGVTLMTASSRGDRTRSVEMRWRLARRGLVLYAGGMLFDFVWPGTILPFYGAMFVLAAPPPIASSHRLRSVNSAAALAAWAIAWWVRDREAEGHDTSWLTTPGPRSPRGLVIDVFVNGTHPLLPWLAFFCTGIVLGRLLVTPWWRPAVAGAGFVAYAMATIVDSAAGDDPLWSADPFDRGIVYTASALGTALIAFTAISWVADTFEQTAPVDVLRRAGQLSLTIYLGHALVFDLLVDTLDVIEPAGLATSLTAAMVYWAVATCLAVAYQRRFGRGPAERVYRRLTC
jgi:uncharacterized protein